MKITSLILPVFVVAGMTTPAFCDDAQPVTAPAAAPAEDAVAAFMDACYKMLDSLKTCTDAAMAVHDATSAAEVAEVFRAEAWDFDEVRTHAMKYMEAAIAALKDDPKGAEFEKEAEEVMGALQMAMANLENLNEPYYGCKELEAAWKLYADVVTGMTPVESDLMPQVIELYRESDMIRYAAWQAIASVTDRASADAATAKLAELEGLQDKSFERMRALLEQVPESQVNEFCVAAYASYENSGVLPEDFAKVSEAAQDNLSKMGSMEPAFYGSPDLQERASMFVRMPR